MRVLFLTLPLLMVLFQNAYCNKINFDLESVENSKFDLNHLRSINDLWTHVKNSGTKTWNYIKNLSKNTKTRIATWVEHVKDHADKITQQIELSINHLHEELDRIIQRVIGTGKNVKDCVKKEAANLKDITKEIIKNVTGCISDSIELLSAQENRKMELDFDDKRFSEELENKLNACLLEPDNVEECLHGVRQGIYEDAEQMEDILFENRLLSRKSADNIIDTVTSCALDGLVDASESIAEVIRDVIECVIKDKENNKEDETFY